MSSERATQLVDAGIWLKLSGDVDGARRLFERALKLDPEHARAKELLAQSATASVAPPFVSSPSNPFERVGSSPSAAEMDWGAATGFEAQQTDAVQTPSLAPAALAPVEAPAPAPAPVPAPAVAPEAAPLRSSDSALTDDWGSATGQIPSPVPQVAPVVPHSTSLFGEERPVPPALTRREPFASSGSQPGTQPASPFSSSDSRPGEPAPQNPYASSGSQPGTQRTTLQFAQTDAPTQPPARSTLPYAPVGAEPPFSSSGSQPGRTTLPFAAPTEAPESAARASTLTHEQLFGSSDSQVGAPAAPGEPVTPPGLHRATLPYAASQPAARQTMMFATQPTSAPSTVVAVPPVFAPPAAPVGPPSLDGSGLSSAPVADAGARTKRDTLTFSTSTAQPLAPSSIPEVNPVVIRLGAEDESEGADSGKPSLEDELRDAVEANRRAPEQAVAPMIAPVLAAPTAPPALLSSPPNPPHRPHFLDPPDPLSGNVVITDRAPEPTPPRATPPMFSEADLPPAPTAPAEVPIAVAAGPEAQSAPSVEVDLPIEVAAPAPANAEPVDDAWNWSASTPGASLGRPGEPAPRPSPQLTPEASSAWDLRSNPGISLADVSAPKAPLEFVSSSSKVTRAPDAKDPKKDEIAVLVRGAKDLIELDDHTGAMELIAKALALAPDDPDVRALQERSERTLLAMFESKLGHLEKLPRVLLKDDEIIWLNLDHRAGFVLAQIDGAMSFDDLFAVSGMSRIDTARILAQLVDEGVISRGG